MDDFNFEYWAQLAKTDPMEFERQRKAALMGLVSRAPAHLQDKLEALVENICAPCQGSPLERAVLAHNQMMKSAHELQAQLGNLVSAAGYENAAPACSVLDEFTELRVEKRHPT